MPWWPQLAQELIRGAMRAAVAMVHCHWHCPLGPEQWRAPPGPPLEALLALHTEGAGFTLKRPPVRMGGGACTLES